jgi:hypothetical protein
MNITSAATQAASSPAEIGAKVEAFISTARGLASDGLSLSEAGELATQLMRLSIAAVDAIPTDGAAKKQFVLDSLGLLFDAVADRLVPLPVYPVWLLLRAPVRSLVLAVASGAIESLLPLVRTA